MKPEVTTQDRFLTIEMAVSLVIKKTCASKRPQPTSVPLPICLAKVPDEKGHSSHIPSPESPPSHCQPTNTVKPGDRKQPADLISSSGALRDCWIVPPEEETLVESSGNGGKVERAFSLSCLPRYKLYPLIGAEVSSCQPDFPLRTNVVRLQQ